MPCLVCTVFSLRDGVKELSSLGRLRRRQWSPGNSHFWSLYTLYAAHCCTHCTVCTAVHTVRCCTHCTLMYTLYTAVHTVHCCTHCTLLYTLYTALLTAVHTLQCFTLLLTAVHTVLFCTHCTLLYTMYTVVHSVHCYTHSSLLYTVHCFTHRTLLYTTVHCYTHCTLLYTLQPGPSRVSDSPLSAEKVIYEAIVLMGDLSPMVKFLFLHCLNGEKERLREIHFSSCQFLYTSPFLQESSE